MNQIKKKILFLTSEISPFCETYQLASFSKKISTLINDMDQFEIRISQPKYGFISERKYILREVIRLKEVPVTFKNNSDSPGLKKGGVLNIVRRKVQLKCEAENIPENLEVDLSGLDIGASVKISSVKLPENAKPTITDRDFVVATIAPPTIVKEPEKPAEEVTAEGVEGETPVTGEGAEATPTKEGEAAKKDDKGKDQPGDKKQATDKKSDPGKKAPEKKEKK